MQGTTSLEKDRFYIGGEWVRPASDRRFTVLDANTGERIGSAPEACEADVDRAVAAARAALSGAWGQMSPQDRSALIARFADALAARLAPLTETVSVQNGMPITLARQLEGEYPVGLLRYYAGLAAATVFEERRASPMGFDTLVRREPVGVVAGIIPWNYPVVLSMFKIGPALASGCTLVLKPSPGTVLDHYHVAEAAAEAGIPPGVLNWVPADRAVGAYLIAHPGVDKVAFTGSTAAGRQIAEVCGRLLRPVTLELGGKSAGIILDDAPLEPTLQGLAFASFMNNGQTCLASTRILAPKSRYAEIVDALAGLASSFKVGASLDPETQIGPLASEAHRQRVEGYIAKGKTEGRLVAGGGRPTGLDRGWFVEPTVFADVSNDATIAREEIFGPVIVITPYADEAEAIRLANDSDYGLGGTVFSADSERAQAVARQVQTGSIGVNGYMLDMNAPFGGVKQSGMGRELGPESLNAYLHYKSIFLPAG